MVEQSFGGPWTERKLKCLQDYLNAYRTIFTGNPRARYFRTWYVDAFAGTGSRSTPRPSRSSSGEGFFEIYDDAEAQEYQDGSAKIALGLSSPFDNYLFIEKSKARVTELQSAIRAEFPQLYARCHFRAGDANAELKGWCAERNWSKDRAVVFLDPYGMQVEWGSVETLAATKGVDLWYLFPGIARLLRRDGNIPEAWKKRLDVLLGTDAWQTRFFRRSGSKGSFGKRKAFSARQRRQLLRHSFTSGWQPVSGKRLERA